MDAHPVPQNVTQFQFRLIGDMTLKQFAYLGTGVGFAYLIFVFLTGVAPLLAWPVIVISSFLGIAFAFIPIQDRPLDHWVKAFLKAIYSPTKRSWKKNGKSYKDSPIFKTRLNIYLTAQRAMAQPLISFPQRDISVSPPQPLPLTQLKEVHSLTTPQPFQPAPTATSTPIDIPPMLSSTAHIVQSTLPTTEELSQTVDLGKKAQLLQTKIIESERQLGRIKSGATQGTVTTAEYTQQFNIIFENLQNLVKEASDIRRQLDQLTKKPQIQKSKVKVEIVKPKFQPTPIVLTSSPNVISGIVVDSEGNYLEGVVVVVHDKEGLPVRALKTNKLGQFTGSTPLANGTFNLELEKDNFIFDVQQIELDGKVIPPLMIGSKTAGGTT